MRYLKLLLLALLIAAGWYWRAPLEQAAHGALAMVNPQPAAKAAPPRAAPPGVPAVVATVEQKEMPVEFRSVGTVQVESSVVLKVRVESVVEKVLVADGAFVKKGDILVELDKSQVLAQIELAKAAIQRDEALIAQAQRNNQRTNDLASRGITSRVTADDAGTAAAVAAANKAANTASLNMLQLQLSFHTIRAPIDGRVGVVNVRPGAFVRNADANSILATINQIDPVYVAVGIPQALLSQILEAKAAGSALIEITAPGTSKSVSGPIAVVDNSVDPATGLLMVRAKVANPDGLVWPGQVVDARVVIRREPGAVVVPSEAVQTSQNGNFVFVVDGASKAHVREIRVARTVGGETVVASGLASGERVVTDGHLRITDGATLAVKPPRARPEARAGSESSEGGVE